MTGTHSKAIEPDSATCDECNSEVRAGTVDGDFGLFCDCTERDGKPFNEIDDAWPWPARWT